MRAAGGQRGGRAGAGRASPLAALGDLAGDLTLFGVLAGDLTLAAAVLAGLAGSGGGSGDAAAGSGSGAGLAPFVALFFALAGARGVAAMRAE